MPIPPVVGQQLTGNGIPAGTTVLALNTNAATVTMSQNATANTNAGAITVGAEPVSVAEAKKWARVEFTDDDTDLIPDLIRAVREWTEGVAIKRGLLLQGRTYYSMGFPWTGGYYNRLIRSMGPNPWWLPTAQGIIVLPYPNLQSVVSVQYIDPGSGTLLTIDPSTYLFSKQGENVSRIMPQYGKVWPLPRPVIDSVQITYAVGYGNLASDVPASVRLAMRSMIAANYENREAYMDGAPLIITGMAQRLMDVETLGSYY